MKKFTLLCALLIVGFSSYSQYDPKARVILDEMSEKIKKSTSYSADITSSLTNKTEGVDEKFEGEITVKGEKYLLKLEDQVIMNDGVTLWTYLPDVNEVNIDNYDPDDDDMSPSNIYDAYKEGYKYIYIGDKIYKGEMTSVIDLIPNDSDAQFFKITLYIAKKDSGLRSWAMNDKAGNVYTYDISNYKSNVGVTDREFKFDPSQYPGVEIVDLRD